jgi:hypothetical protein
MDVTIDETCWNPEVWYQEVTHLAIKTHNLVYIAQLMHY